VARAPGGLGRSWGEGDGIDWIEKGISICLGSCFCERGCAVEMVWRRYFGGVVLGG